MEGIFYFIFFILAIVMIGKVVHRGENKKKFKDEPYQETFKENESLKRPKSIISGNSTSRASNANTKSSNTCISDVEVERAIYSFLLEEKKDEATLLQAKVECDGDAEKAETKYYQLRYHQIVESGEINRIRERILADKSRKAEGSKIQKKSPNTEGQDLDEPDENIVRFQPTRKESKIMVKLETSMGDILLELDKEKAPKSVTNFLNYVNDGHYDGTIFHRVIDGFMIQGGGLTKDMREKSTKDPIENEADNGLKNDAYTVAIARTPDPHSATSQFFINVKKNDFLNHTAKNAQGWGYAVFGKVAKGHMVVNEIRGVATGNHGPHADVPKEPITIKCVSVVKG